MTIQEAERIIDIYNHIEDLQCSCHISAPCNKCEIEMELDMELSEEIIEEAEKIIENHYNEVK